MGTSELHFGVSPRRFAREFQISPSGVILFSITLDVSVACIAGMFTHVFSMRNVDSVGFETAATVGGLAGVLFCYIGWNTNLYRHGVDGRNGVPLARLLACWSAACLFLCALVFFVKVSALLPRRDAMIFFVSGLLGLSSSQIMRTNVLRYLSRSGSIKGLSIFLIADAGEARDLGSLFMAKSGLREVGRVCVDNLGDAGAIQNAVRTALEQARKRGAREIIVALPWHRQALIQQITMELRATPLPVRLLPDSAARALLTKHAPFTTPASTIIEVKRAPLSRIEVSIKRFLDIFGSAVGLLVLWPLLVVVALAIRLDSPGPVLFRQRRRGFDEQVFQIFKFRSMTVMEDGAAVNQATRNDKRVTRVGAVLRRTSLDEVPQLLNVLLGDMSLVGPRPHALAHDNQFKECVAQYAYRHHVKPGITGWAQVNGLRGETASVDKIVRRVEKDLWYVDNWSFWLDIAILLKTTVSLAGKNTY